MRARLERIVNELLDERYAAFPFTLLSPLRVDGVTDGWRIHFLWEATRAANIELLIIPETLSDVDIRDLIQAEIDRMLPGWRNLESA